MPDLIIKTKWENEEVDQFCADVLTTAAEGGIGYWASYNTERRSDHTVVSLSNLCDVEEGDPFENGHRLGIPEVWSTLQEIAQGKFDMGDRLRTWIVNSLKDKDTAMIDADAADVIIQCALFGEIVYG